MFVLECTDTVELCYNARKILIIIKELVKLIQWSVPLLLVFLGTLDMFKAVTKADDEKAVKDAATNFGKRLIAGVVIFLIPFLVRLVLGLVENNILTNNDGVSTTSWVACWNNVGEKDSSYFAGCKDIYQSTNNSSGK